jgi:two-component system, OmpR family, sensor kinase
MSVAEDVPTGEPEPPASRRRQRRDRRHAGFLLRLSRRTPLRTKLITGVLLLVILALTAISFSSAYVLRSYLTSRDDDQVSSAYQNDVQHLGQIFNGASLNTWYPVLGTGYYTGLLQPGDTFKSPSSGTGSGTGGTGGLMGGSSTQQSVPDVRYTKAWIAANTGTIFSVGSKSGDDVWRITVNTITLNGVADALVVGVDLGDINAEIQRLIIVNVIVSLAVVVVLAVVAVGVVRTNLRPLDDIEMIAGQIALGNLNHRVPEGDPRTEIGSLGRSLNAMLTQIESAFHAQEASERAAHESEERMRRFIADASHELRTPLTTIRGFAAHYRQRGGGVGRRSRQENTSYQTEAVSPFTAPSSPGPEGLSGEELDHLMGRVEAEATRMGLLVEDLLTLARLDQQRPLAKGPVDLLTLAADAVQDARIVSPGRPIDLSVAPGTAFIVDGDESRLRQVLNNLVNNALTHTPDGTPVRVKIGRGTLGADAAEAPAVVLDVEDDGPGMNTDQARRVFERFYRADAARNRASGGTGLGLAIVAGLVQAHGGTVSVRTEPGQGADFQVRLPLSPDVLAVDEADDDLLG